MAYSNLSRRQLLQMMLAAGGSTLFSSPAAHALALPGINEPASSHGKLPAASLSSGFVVHLPSQRLPFPNGVQEPGFISDFRWRGIKGLTWVADQYLEEIPVMAKFKMNFLQNCYTSLWDLESHGTWAHIPNESCNHWYKPLPPAKKRAYAHVAQECLAHGMEFCFSMNPSLASPHPLTYDNSRDFEILWSHYEWMQGLGVKWFNVSLDDSRHGINPAGQAKVTNELLRRLRMKDQRAQMIFTPTWYAGTGDSGPETAAKLGTGDTRGVRYVKELGDKLDRDIHVYWTGPEVASVTISREDAEKYQRLVRHRLFIWDNYPCNDQHPNLQLGPLTGRASDLSSAAGGYISNPLSPQNQANRIPMLTIADYLWNPTAYDPNRSIGQSILHLAETREQQSILQSLVELYPGRLIARSQSTAWNSLLEAFDRGIKAGQRTQANALLHDAEKIRSLMSLQFPHRFALALDTMSQNCATMDKQFTTRLAVG